MRRIACFGWAWLVVALAALVGGCLNPGAGPKGGGGAVQKAEEGTRILADFEKPNGLAGVPDVMFTPAEKGSGDPFGTTNPATNPPTNPASTAPAPGVGVLLRSSIRPFAGLWSEQVVVGKTGTAGAKGGTIGRDANGAGPEDLSNYDVVTAQVIELGGAGANGQWLAAMVITDAAGNRVEGDYFGVTSQWSEVTLDLSWARDEGINVKTIKTIGVKLRPAGSAAGANDEGLEIQTDQWLAAVRKKTYAGDPAGRKGTFFVAAQGDRLRVGSADLFELDLWNRGTMISGTGEPMRLLPHGWMEILTGNGDGVQRRVVGQPGTGLMLVDSAGLDGFRQDMQRGADDGTEVNAGTLPAESWPAKPGEASRWSWRVAWAAATAAIVEVTQECGPYDKLGEPAGRVVWRFTIYSMGEVYVHADWTRGGNGPGTPASWAMVMEEGMMDRSGDAAALAGNNAPDVERLLSDIYTASVREGLQTALPHTMQRGWPVGLIGKSAAGGGKMARDSWWWARGRTPNQEGVRRVIGCGIAPAAAGATSGKADCMLALTAPDVLRKAGTFGQYLAPPKLVLKQGELDRNFPGDADNDGFVEGYGFQAIRLAAGRAEFTIYPQERPLFHPAYLFTVPAAEQTRNGGPIDLSKMRVLINIDGKQFEDPPMWPDGSFLLQLPWGLDKPVTVEAVLERR